MPDLQESLTRLHAKVDTRLAQSENEIESLEEMLPAQLKTRDELDELCRKLDNQQFRRTMVSFCILHYTVCVPVFLYVSVCCVVIGIDSRLYRLVM